MFQRDGTFNIPFLEDQWVRLSILLQNGASSQFILQNRSPPSSQTFTGTVTFTPSVATTLFNSIDEYVYVRDLVFYNEQV